jgi:hypothetical protein
MKKLLITLVFTSIFSALLFGVIADEPVKTSKAKQEKKIAVFGDFGFSRNISHSGKRDLFMQGGAQYRINPKFFAEALFNYHFNSDYPDFFNGRRSWGFGLAGVYRKKLNERLNLDLKAGVLLHWDVIMIVYGNSHYTYGAFFGLQGGPGLEYMFLPNLGARVGTTFNLLFEPGTPFWFGLSSGLVFKL